MPCADPELRGEDRCRTSLSQHIHSAFLFSVWACLGVCVCDVFQPLGRDVKCIVQK